MGSTEGRAAATPRVVVVIPNWNGRHLLERCLPAVAAQTFAGHVVLVVDNGSTDDSVAFVRAHHPEADVLALDTNVGFAGAVNAGIRASRSEYVVLLNNDTEPRAAWLDELVRALDNVPDADFAASRMVRLSDPLVLDSAGDGFSLARGCAYSIGAGTPAHDHVRGGWVFGACAGAAIYRRRLFDEIGLFDEDFFFLHEDSDFNLRARVAGRACLFVPDAVVAHRRGASSEPSARLRALSLRNRVWVAWKNLPPAALAGWCLIAGPRLVAIASYRIVTNRARGVYWREVRAAVGGSPAKRRAVAALRRTSSVALAPWLVRPFRPL